MDHPTSTVQIYRQSLPTPKDDDEFEDMCTTIYGRVFDDLRPQRNGRKGQKQGGVDIFISPAKAPGTRIGIQCKRVIDGALTFAKISEEVEKADAVGTRINSLIVATTAQSDSKLLREVHELSDSRQASGKFSVGVDFWSDISEHINRDSFLAQRYAPQSPGAIFAKIEERTTAIPQISQDMAEVRIGILQIKESLSVPSAQVDSADKIITDQIDSLTKVLNGGRFRDVMDQLNILAKNFPSFDAHQRARWHVQRGICRLHNFDESGAAEDFLAAWDLYPLDQKIVAARVRGLTLQNKFADAIEAGESGLKNFPGSVFIWTATAYARLNAGQTIAERDLPLEMRGTLEAVQLMCWNALENKDFERAGTLGRELLRFADVGATGRTVALASAVALANSDPVAAMYGLINPGARESLKEVIQAFEPHTERLWSNQSAVSLPDDVANLAYGYRLLGEPEKALNLLDAAPEVVRLSPKVMSIRFAILRTLNRDDEVLEFARNKSEIIDQCVFLVVADAAATVGDIDLVEKLKARSSELTDQDQRDVLTGFMWIALANANRIQEAIDRATLNTLPMDARPALLVFASRVFLMCQRLDDANVRLNRAVALLKDHDSPDIRLMLGDLMAMSGRHTEASELYAPLATVGMFSDLHKKLLIEYLKSRQRRKAKDLLESFPPNWTLDDQARDIAIRLANIAGDWTMLQPLSSLEMKRAPRSAGSWMLRFAVEEQLGTPASFSKLLGEMPFELNGTSYQIGRMACLEICRGSVEKGMARLYSVFRKNLEDINAAKVFLTTMLCNPNVLPYMPATVTAIAGNTSCTLVDNHGQEIVLTIDPEDVGELPKWSGFFSKFDEQIQPILGKRIGETVRLHTEFGVPCDYTVISITTAFHRLLHITQEKARSPLNGMQGVSAIHVINADGTADLAPLNEMLSRQADHSKFIFDQYGNQPATLGICAKLLGTTPTELLLSWPDSAPPIKLSSGSAEDRRGCFAKLQTGMTVVTDLETLVLLVRLDAEDALACFDSVFVSTFTDEQIRKLVRVDQMDNSSGHISSQDGQLQFSPQTAERKDYRVQFFERVLHTLEKYCQVCPVYGGADIEPEFIRIEECLGEEEYDSILLAHEKKAHLFSLDQKLREIAKVVAGVDGVDVQAVFREALFRKKIKETVFLAATRTLFVGNFTYVSLDPGTLIWMILQGDQSRDISLTRYREVIGAENSDFVSATSVIFEALESLFRLGYEPEIIVDLLEIFCEPLFKIPNCQIDRMTYLSHEVANFILGLESQNPVIRGYNLIPGVRAALGQLFMNAIDSAQSRVKNNVGYKAFSLQLTYVSKIPMLRCVKQ